MITEQQTFEVNSYFCKKANDSSDIEYVFDIPQDYEQLVTHFSVTSITIPNTFTQLDSGDIMYLQEDDLIASISYTPGSYLTKKNLMLDLQNKLNLISPKGLIYIVEDNNTLLDDNAIKISVNEPLVDKIISFNDKYLRLTYGLASENFFNTILISNPINLSPISTIYVHSNISSSYNTSGLNTSDIIATVDVNKCGSESQFSIHQSMKNFSGQKQARFKLTDFDNFYLNLYDNDWRMTIVLYHYQESWLDRLNHFISLAATYLDQVEKTEEVKFQKHEYEEFENEAAFFKYYKLKGDTIVPR